MQDILKKIEEAEMVLVGLGEDFDNKKFLSSLPNYVSGCEALKEAECTWLIPAWGEFCAEKNDNRVQPALEKLAALLKDKNYFVVSVSANSEVAGVQWKHDRFVMPCGSSVKKQCICGCDDVYEVGHEDRDNLRVFFEKLYSEGVFEKESVLLGNCPKCGKSLIFNNIYAEKYKEEGYLPRWEIYMKWLQGTLNRKLLLLELGVGMKYPSVVRWPFEKVAFFNQKAYFCRIHENLYQLTPELSGKGCGISRNAIDWLKML